MRGPTFTFKLTGLGYSDDMELARTRVISFACLFVSLAGCSAIVDLHGLSGSGDADAGPDAGGNGGTGGAASDGSVSPTGDKDGSAATDAATDSGGSGDGSIVIPTVPDSDKLCVLPQTRPRLHAVSEGERTCSESGSTWPDCIPDQCDAPDFAAACKQLCNVVCERERWFCTVSHCKKQDGGLFCDSAKATEECMTRCADDPDCLNLACQEVRDSTCSDMKCLDPGASNSCGGLTCENSCGSSSDGVCQDGSPINSTAESCDLGSDCNDCGAREDQCLMEGAECFATVQCCGFDKNAAHCINVGTADSPLGRCVRDCTGDPQGCPDGFSCVSLQGGESACFPLCSLDE